MPQEVAELFILIVNSIAPMFESFADKNPRKIGAYLIWIGLASCCVSSSIFLTGQAPNSLALSLINQNGVEVVDWLSWFLAFCLSDSYFL